MGFQPTYHKRNLVNIMKLAPITKNKALQLYSYACRSGIDVLIYETIRTEAKQRENVKNGKSQTMKSYHLVGQAFDFVLIDDKGKEIWNGYSLPDAKNFIAYAKGLGFTWGGDWNNDGSSRDETFIDSPHLQYTYKGWGTDKVNPSVKVATVKIVNPTYTVKPGDTLSKILGTNAKEKIEVVVKKNKLLGPDKIFAGQKLIL